MNMPWGKNRYELEELVDIFRNMKDIEELWIFETDRFLSYCLPFINKQN